MGETSCYREKELFKKEVQRQTKSKMNIDNKYTEYLIPREDITYSVEFCNVETASQLLAVGTEFRVSLYQCKFKVIFRVISFRGYWTSRPLTNSAPDKVGPYKLGPYKLGPQQTRPLTNSARINALMILLGPLLRY